MDNDDWVRGPNEDIAALTRKAFIPVGVIKKRPLYQKVLNYRRAKENETKTPPRSQNPYQDTDMAQVIDPRLLPR